MRILVLGASGGCGRWLTRFACEGGHHVTALVRHGTPFESLKAVAVKRGSVLDEIELTDAMDGQDVVISCVGPQRVEPRNPWSPLRQPPHVGERSVRMIIEVMHNLEIRRLVAISAAGVGNSLERTNRVMKWLMARSAIGEMYDDLNAMEGVLRDSRLEWVALRPVTLVNAKPSGRAKVVAAFRTHSVIGRADVAKWLLRVAVSKTPPVQRTPMISWW